MGQPVFSSSLVAGRPTAKEFRPAVSIVVKTYDDTGSASRSEGYGRWGELLATWLRETLEALEHQSLPPQEVIVVDSGSGAGIARVLSQREAGQIPVRRIVVPSREFSHPRALNLGVRDAASEIVVSLSGDATPANDSWLERLVLPLADPKVAGAYSRQIPRPGVKQCLMERLRLWWRYRGESTTRRSDPLFSNASSAFRRALAMEVPFDERLRELEDYDWAMKVRAKGYFTVYAGQSEVCHSHTSSSLQTLTRMIFYAYLRLRLHALVYVRSGA